MTKSSSTQHDKKTHDKKKSKTRIPILSVALTIKKAKLRAFRLQPKKTNLSASSIELLVKVQGQNHSLPM